MPGRSRLTPWCNWRQRPRRPGIYQVMWMGVTYYSHWNGFWAATAETTQNAHANRYWKTALPIRYWRGLTEP